ncbi:MAG: response regulator [Verrucomicrobiota bacterium]|nr:response regulator [Verrucomicrobiota bacterium]
MNPAEKILIVDDDEPTRYALSRIISSAGYQVTVASSGKEALEKAASLQPDLVLLDVQLPDMSGFEVVKLIRADPLLRHLFIVHLTALSTREDDFVEGLEQGADGYLVHPLTNRELIARIRAYLRHNQTLKQLRESEGRYRTFFESNPLPVWIADAKERKILLANPAAFRLYGYSQEELTHLNEADLIISSRREGDEESAVHQDKNGARLQVTVVRHPLTWGGNAAEAMIITDVTELQAQESSYQGEIRSLEQFSEVEQKFGAQEWEQLLQQYWEVLQLKLEQETYKVEHNISERLRVISEELAAGLAGPRDVVRLHHGTITARVGHLGESAKAKPYVRVGRFLLIELMGQLLAIYRRRSAVSGRA